MSDDETWWWLSFCDTAKPAGQQFLGVAIVRGTNVATAAATAHRLGSNPGGQVMGFPMPDPAGDPAELVNRLLSKVGADAADGVWFGAAATGCTTSGELEDAREAG